MTVHADDHDLDVMLLERYCSGTASPAERARLDDWFRQRPKQAHWYAQLRAGLKTGAFPAVSAEQSRAIREEIIRAALRRRPGVGETTKLRERRGLGRILLGGGFKPQPLRRSIWYTLTGAVLGVLAIVAGWHIGTPRLTGHDRVAVSAYVTGNGERANITLPDGNAVALNVASRLEVPADYLAGNHTLHLSGEALFTVTHQKTTPFVVVTGSDTALVLGTSFSTRRYATDTTVMIAVREGKVAVHAGPAASVILTAAHQVMISRTGIVQMGEIDAGRFSFATGILTLTSTPFLKAIPELDRWYNADIRLGDTTLITQRLTGEYAAGSLADLTELLEGTYNVRVVRNGRVLTLFRRQN